MEKKKEKQDEEEAPPNYTLYYHAIPFRGQFMRMAFALTRTRWLEGDPKEMYRLRDAGDEGPALFVAPPLLHDAEDDLWLSQTPAIMAHLAPKLGLVPDSRRLAALALKVLCDCNDVLNEVTEQCGHKMWTHESFAEFRARRFPRWLSMLETLATREGGLKQDNGFFLGTEAGLTLADVAVVAVLHTLERSVAEFRDDLRKHCPKVMSLCDRLAQDKGVVALLEGTGDSVAGRVDVYCGGMIERSLRSVLKGGDGKP